jgi:ubiquinone/menaquinone biosynthesis C-methylase UbiE
MSAMTDKHIEFVGSIPEIYDEYLGPLLFEYYAADLAGRVTVPPGGRVLEMACGTGIATERLRAALPEDVEIAATDLNEAMLDFARNKRGDLAKVHYQVANAQDLPFEDASFDAVVCQFGIMFFPDKAAAAREALRVLKPGGTYAFNVWDSLDRNPVVGVFQDCLNGFFDKDPPAFMSIPYGYHALDPMVALLRDAGFGAIEINIVPTVVERPSAHDVARGCVEGNPGIHEIQARATVPVAEIVEAVAAALREEFGDAPLRAPLQAIAITARKPEET